MNPSQSIDELQSIVKEMCTIQRHGGPDDEGMYSSAKNHLVLGHRRLSLIDLSACGHQPMSYADGRFEISFNGEIYNYRELKSELKSKGFSFTTESDTEVILAAFAAWGTDCFNRLNGMFALALWDGQEKKLFLARDPSGIKPLYYAHTKEGFAFASEVKAFKPISWLQEENPYWRIYLMAYGHLPEPITILKKVQPLEKGHFLCYDLTSQEIALNCYKQFHFSETITNRGEAIQGVKEILAQSVKRHLIADAPIGVFLSGGLDSSIIALLANRDGQSKLNSLSLYFEDHEFSEKKYQDLLIEQLQCKRNQFLLQESDFHQNLPGILNAMDQPGCDGINTWYISKYAKENGLKAVLSGVGGDELFGGYPSFHRIKMVNLLKQLPQNLLHAGKYTGLKQLKRLGYLSIQGAIGKYLFLRGQFIPSEIAAQLNMDEEQVWKILNNEPKSEVIAALSSHNQASWLETNLYMQNQLLRDSDVMSMAHGVEIRVPFLDKEFVELALQIASPVKYAGARPKQLLIDSFSDMLPEPIWKRPKMGFGFPFKDWLGRSEYAKDMLSHDNQNQELFMNGKMHWSQYLSLLLLKKYSTES